MSAGLVELPEADVPPTLRRQVLAAHAEAWPAFATDDDGPTHDPALAPRSLLLVEDGRVLAALDLLTKDIELDGVRLRASGLSTVVTPLALRGRGHGSTLVRAARRAIAARGDDLALFTCDAELAPFYVACGFTLVPGACLVGGTPDDPFPSDALGKVVLVDLCTPRARALAPRLPGARILLYPGTIDRLW